MKRGRMVCALMLALVLLCLTACGAGSTMSADREASYAGGAATNGSAQFFDGKYSVMTDAAEPSAPKEKESGQSASGSVYRNSEVKLIRRASLTVQTTQFDQSALALSAVVEALGGYFEQSELYSGNYNSTAANRSGHYVIRVPAEKYDEFLTQVDGVGHLTRKSETTEDIGERYYDTQSRLATQQAKRERLQELLKKAGSMEDIIALESALADVEYQIEQLTGQLRRYDGLVGFATFTVALEEVIRVVDEPGERESVFTRMGAGIVSSANGLVTGVQNALVWMSYHLFALVFWAAVLVLGGVFGVRTIRNRKGREKASEQPEENR
ncbi:MAG: DUF4349 domain-containing protein [Oscillospiraceae bacterium]|nr:DUF4349 domain-containing protein [Oscillospiraceae bacterium]